MCHLHPVTVWMGVTASMAMKIRNVDVPSTSATDAEMLATAPGRPRIAEMISGPISTNGIRSSPRKNQMPVVLKALRWSRTSRCAVVV